MRRRLAQHYPASLLIPVLPALVLLLSSAVLCLEYLPLSSPLHDAVGSRVCPL